jgi:hypothetical protein
MKNIILAVGFLVMVSGCASITPAEKSASQGVKVADLSFLNGDGKGCKNLGPVMGDSAGAVGGQSAAVEHMRVMALKKGSNIVVSNLSFTKTMGILTAADMVKGIALRCSDTVHANLVSIDQLANF